MNPKRTLRTIINTIISDTKQNKGGCKVKLYLVSFTLNFSLIASTPLWRNILPPEVPLLYGLPEGENQLVQWWLLGTPAAAATAFTTINFLICKRSKNIFIQQLSTYILIPINFFSIVTIIKILILTGGI